MYTTRGKILIALLALGVLVLMFQVASAQYGGGRGGYYGGRGGGRGGYYGGRGDYGGGRGGYYGGRGGYGGGRGGGRYGGYGGRAGYDYSASEYPYGMGGGVYSYGDDDDFSYLDVYATSSATPTSAVASSETTSGSSSSAAGVDTNSDWTNAGEQAFDGPMPQWAFARNQPAAFDLVTGAERSLAEQAASNGPGGSSSTSANDRTRERNVLSNGGAPQAGNVVASPTIKPGDQEAALRGPLNAVPSVPSSTTTAAPEYVMINPTTTTTNRRDDNTSDQEE